MQSKYTQKIQEITECFPFAHVIAHGESQKLECAAVAAGLVLMHPAARSRKGQQSYDYFNSQDAKSLEFFKRTGAIDVKVQDYVRFKLRYAGKERPVSLSAFWNPGASALSSPCKHCKSTSHFVAHTVR